MSVSDKYYGEALRELENDERRDDLWAKAYAQSQGDESKTKARYIELLARHLAEIDPERVSMRAQAAVRKQEAMSQGSYRFGYSLARMGWRGGVWVAAALVALVLVAIAGGS
ncbi:hypothetical protein [Bordetella trematum]|uniref:hypothetical protein n=1 Tax=Bordetella trematum TaxID=123899 RepID=UPI000D9EBDED|nr:hypothetical protein [Bordetella trematum]SPU54096.1 Uncharacterised protein [Bordetella trematum]VDH06611.1 Uncharacterised protein [Bordetella trematum]